MRWLALLVLAAGCDRVFFLDHVDDSDASADSALAGCPAGFTWIAEHESAYKVEVTPSADWTSARALCSGMTIDPTMHRYVHLAVLSSQLEYNAIRMLPGYTGMPWVGFSDQNLADDTSIFTAVTNEADIAIPWDVTGGLPDGPDTQNCARMFNLTGLDDNFCAVGAPYVCECDGNPDTTQL